MSRSVRVVSLAALVLVVASTAAGQPAASAAPVSRDWKQLRADGFTVVGDASPADLERAAEDVERFREAAGRTSTSTDTRWAS